MEGRGTHQMAARTWSSENAENTLMQSQKFPNNDKVMWRVWSLDTIDIDTIHLMLWNSPAQFKCRTIHINYQMVVFHAHSLPRAAIFSAQDHLRVKRSICMCVSHVTDRISFSTNIAKRIVIVGRSANTCKYLASIFHSVCVLPGFIGKTSPLCDNVASAASMTVTDKYF